MSEFPEDDGPDLGPRPAWLETVGEIEPKKKQHKPAPGEDVLASFGIATEPERAIVDRSTLEHYAKCPAMARLIESGAVLTASNATESGTEAHTAISKTIAEWIASRGESVPYDDLGNLARGSRADVQPDVLSALMPSAWHIAQYIRRLHPDNILRFDGGAELDSPPDSEHGNRSGQLSFDIGGLPVRVTSEVDLLHSTEAPAVLQVIDWKTGRKPWTETMVAESFQFQLHALLVLENYPKIEAVDVSIWATRLKHKTHSVRFTRSRLADYKSRIATAAGEWYQWRESENPPCWPTVEKCEICSGATLCPLPVCSDTLTAKEMVDALVAVEATADAMKKTLAATVDKRGEDIVTSSGNRFGRAYPAAKKKRVAKLYEEK